MLFRLISHSLGPPTIPIFKDSVGVAIVDLAIHDQDDGVDRQNFHELGVVGLTCIDDLTKPNLILQSIVPG